MNTLKIKKKLRMVRYLLYRVDGTTTEGKKKRWKYLFFSDFFDWVTWFCVYLPSFFFFIGCWLLYTFNSKLTWVMTQRDLLLWLGLVVWPVCYWIGKGVWLSDSENQEVDLEIIEEIYLEELEEAEAFEQMQKDVKKKLWI